MSAFKIPLLNIPQSFDIDLAGKSYVMTCRWNSAIEGGWTIDFADAITGDSIIAGIPLITGADCLAGLEYLGFQGVLVVYTDGDTLAVPTFENLGVESNLYFDTDVVDNG